MVHTGSLAAMETAQDALTNLGLSLSQAPLVQLAPGQTVAPVQTLQAAVHDALQCQVNQLAFADKVCKCSFLSCIVVLASVHSVGMPVSFDTMHQIKCSTTLWPMR